MTTNHKRFLIGAIAMVMMGVATNAQTQYDAARMTDNDLNGTARFVGMGGAMGALGGDISTISTNPAGIGLFRRNDLSMSMSLLNNKTSTDMQGVKGEESNTRMSFDQLGLVISRKVSNEDALRYFNFGLNYHKQRNFNRRMTMYGDLFGQSLTGQIAWMGNTGPGGGYDPIALNTYDRIYNDLSSNYYGDQWDDISWLSVLGIQGGLIGPQIGTEPQEGDRPWTDADGNQYVDADGNPLYEYQHYEGMAGHEAIYKSRETGGVNVFDFNLSANINDRVYLGMTVGAHFVNYKRTSAYSEVGEFDGQETLYTLSNSYRTEGSGVNAKFGIIFRPIEASPFRVGLAIHTPTCYELKDTHSASLTSNVGGYDYTGSTDKAVSEYILYTPWKFNLSLGHTVGTWLALGAEYEYTDYSSAGLHYDEEFEMEEENTWIEEDLKGVHTFRVGMEAKLLPEFSLRAGYNYSTASFEKGAYKWLYPNTTRTDAEYENMMNRNCFSVGLGYRIGQLYLDAAYQYTLQKSEFYPFDSQYSAEVVEYPTTTDGLLPATDVKSERNQFMFTVGYRF